MINSIIHVVPFKLTTLCKTTWSVSCYFSVERHMWERMCLACVHHLSLVCRTRLLLYVRVFCTFYGTFLCYMCNKCCCYLFAIWFIWLFNYVKFKSWRFKFEFKSKQIFFVELIWKNKSQLNMDEITAIWKARLWISIYINSF